MSEETEDRDELAEAIRNYESVERAMLSGSSYSMFTLDEIRKDAAKVIARHYIEQFQQARQVKPMSDQPKEPRYRRKPLEWKLDRSSTCNIWKATAFGQSFSIYERGSDCIAAIGLMEWCEYGANLEEAKASVEAEITRRLESVLEVVND